MAVVSYFKWSCCDNPFFVEIFGEPRIVCASVSTSPTPIPGHAPQEADAVGAEEPIPQER